MELRLSLIYLKSVYAVLCSVRWQKQRGMSNNCERWYLPFLKESYHKSISVYLLLLYYIQTIMALNDTTCDRLPVVSKRLALKHFRISRDNWLKPIELLNCNSQRNTENMQNSNPVPQQCLKHNTACTNVGEVGRCWGWISSGCSAHWLSHQQTAVHLKEGTCTCVSNVVVRALPFLFTLYISPALWSRVERIIFRWTRCDWFQP